MKVFDIITKNIKSVLRSKKAIFILFVFPALLVVAISSAFNSIGFFDIKIAHFSENYSNLSFSLIEMLENRGYKTMAVETINNCIENVKVGVSHVCIVFPKNMEVGKETQIVEVYVDSSKINFAYIITSDLYSAFALRAENVSIELIGVIIQVLENTRNELENRKEQINPIFVKVNEVRIRNNEIILEANSIDTQFYEDFQTRELKKKIKEVQHECENCSNEIFETIYGIISDIETKLKKIEEKFNYIEYLKNSIKSKAEDLNQKANEIDFSLNAIKEKIDSMINEIDQIRAKKPEVLAEPIKVSVNSVITKATNLNILFPMFFIFFLTALALLFSSLFSVIEIKSPSSQRLFLVPSSEITFIMGDFLSILLFVLVNAAIAFFLMSFFVTFDLGNIVLPIAIVVLLVSSFFIFVGMIIGYITRKEETAIISCLLLIILFAFFSGIAMPLEMMPSFFRTVANANPFLIALETTKKIVLFSSPIKNLLPKFFVLFASSLIAFLFTFFIKKITKKI